MKRKENKIKLDPTQRYDERKRNNISNAINGGIYKTILDNSHPIGLGYSTDYYTLKRSALAYSLLEKGFNVSYIPEGATAVAGFVGKNVANAQEKSLIIGSESIGKGSVSYFVDNPIFRSFGKMENYCCLILCFLTLIRHKVINESCNSQLMKIRKVL